MQYFSKPEIYQKMLHNPKLEFSCGAFTQKESVGLDLRDVFSDSAA